MYTEELKQNNYWMAVTPKDSMLYQAIVLQSKVIEVKVSFILALFEALDND